jgi:hypothetical protein
LGGLVVVFEGFVHGGLLCQGGKRGC